jgi:thymidylate kinase
VCQELGADVKMMAKFETTASLECIEEILAESDGMMVARGDLGPAVEFIRLPEAQERLVAASRLAGKVSVVATQILESFVETGLPQRPELSDLSLIARQRADVMMLGKETVYSPRPVEAIRLAREVMTYETRRIEKALTSVPRSLAVSLGNPYVVAIEGPNGTGKTPLSKRLSQDLGLPCVRGVPQAWDDPAAKLRMIRDADWLASAMYFLSGVIEASRQLAAGDGAITIMDRSVWSTLAVNYAHDPGRMEVLMPLVDLAAGRIKVPDLTIVLEASPATCRQRVAGKAPAERQFDQAAPDDDEFQLREREFYRALGQQWPRMEFVNTDGCDFEVVYQKAVELVRTLS